MMSGLEEKKKAISNAGLDRLYVISDFDRTLTKEVINGKQVPSMISILRDGNYLSERYAEQAKALFAKYHPIEIDASKGIDEKKPIMKQWWIEHFHLLIKSGLNKKHIKSIIDTGQLQLREGCKAFLKLLYEKKIPIIILSSNGLGGDAISLFLEKEGINYDNIFIVSNSYNWDEQGNAISVKEPVVHVMNKDETAIPAEIEEKIIGRRNAILLGDSLGDVNMAKGEHDAILKIGFLNQGEENKEEYEKEFDMLILDGKMNKVLDLLKEIA
ncbi:MAG: hypothetical protein ACP5D2_04530 [Candidatus Nanoarchaeia archaeon]